MNTIKKVTIGAILIFTALVNSGCALIATALSAGAAYGIYQATKK